MYKIIFIPLAVGFIAQVLKFIIKLAKGEKLSLSLVFSYGGIPSAHTALALSVLILIGLTQGIFNAIFAVAMVFTILIIRDALGIRKYLDSHSQAINKLVNELPNNHQDGFIAQKEQIGHTPLEVLLGAILGGALTVLLYWILP